MRVITGKYRGRKLLEFRGRDIRPTLDRVKESLFNILSPMLYDCVFVDLFCGTGAIGIEALSRGAEKVYFFDADDKSASLTNKNLKSLGESERAEVCSFENALLSLKNKSIKADIVYIDPPYSSDYAHRALNLIDELKILSEGGIAVVESEGETDIDTKMKLFDERRYGRAKLSFYKYSE